MHWPSSRLNLSAAPRERFVLSSLDIIPFQLCRHRTTTTWNCLISRFVEDVNTRQRLSFSFPELRYSLLEFNCRHFASIWRTERDGIRATWLFKWRFRVAIAVFVSSLIGSFLHRRRRRQREHHFKMNSSFFSLCSVYSSSLKISKVGNFPGVDLFGTSFKFGKWKTNSSSLVYVYSMTRKIRHFHVVVVQWQPEIYQKEWCTFKLVVLLNKPIAFWRCRCRRRRKKSC